MSRHFPGLVAAGSRHLRKLERKKAEEGCSSSAMSALKGRLSTSTKERGGRERPEVGAVEKISRDLRFAGIPLAPEEVVASAWFATAVSAAVMLLVIAAIIALGGLSTALLAMPFASIVPFVVYSLTANYPELRAKRMRIKSLGSAPEAVTYMAMSLKLSPSLNRAVEFTAENTEEPLAERLRVVLWDVYTRKKESIEESFMGFANDWGEWNEDLKRSLYGLLSAAEEGTQEGLGRGLERAQDTVRAGARRRMEEFVASLKMPATAFFALCVLLPLIIGTTLPVLSLGGMGVPSIETVREGPTAGSGIPVMLLLDVVFPAVAFVYSLVLLGRRPGTTGSPRVVREAPQRKRLRLVSKSCMVAALPLVFLLLPIGVFSSVALLWSIVLGISTYLLLESSERRKKRRETLILEQQMPDAIFIIGCRLSEGLSVEQALAKTSESLRGMAVAEFLDRIRFSLQLHRRGLEETLFGREGLLRDHPSRMVRVALKMVVDLSRKDPSAAGKALVDFSHYLRDLQEVEKDIKSKLGEIVDAMRSTASFFAPLVLGITSALYMLLAKSFGGLAPLPISSESFVVALGLYLVVMVPVIANFSIGLETGGDSSELAGYLGRTWPTSLALFTAAMVASVVGLGI